MKIFRILKEINNYFFIKKTIRKNKNTDGWKKHNLREGYLGIIYTVINLPPEVFESEEQYYQLYVIEQLKPINEYLASLNMQEVVTLRIENKCNKELAEYAFGVKYVPLFRDFSLFWILKWTAISLVAWWAILKFDLLEKGKTLCEWIFKLIHP
jgi:hypothetical protein